MRPLRFVVLVAVICLPFAFGACDGIGDSAPETRVVIDNHYSNAVVYRAFWQAVGFGDAIAPGASSDEMATVAASPNTAWVVLAPGWDPDGGTTPTSFVVLQSRQGFEVHLGDTLHIEVDDATFDGNCATGNHLTQDQADFATNRIFADVFANLAYDPATCTTTPIGDGGAR